MALRLPLLLLLEHLEHPVGDHEAAHHVDGGHDHGDDPDDRLRRPLRRGREHEQRADNADPADGVGARHQRGVQDRRYLGDDLEAHEAREHEDIHRKEQSSHNSIPLPGYAPMASRVRSCTTSVSYTHLTLPTIYSV